jgi:hypothetical protein
VTNGRHRARWLAEMVSDAQHYVSKAREAPEADLVRRAASLLQDARKEALSDAGGDDERRERDES